MTSGKPDRHDCQPRIDVAAWQDALADYFDSGANHDLPQRQRLEDIKFT